MTLPPTRDHFARLETIFDAALALDETARDEYLDEVCAGDAALRADVASLLACHSRAQAVMDEPFLGDHTVATRVRSDAAGDRIGHYRLIRPVGRGGMGEVWCAERADEQFQQRVAIKLLRAGHDGAEIVRRFRRERQMLAGLEHPNIARLIDGGSTDDGRPYVVMEYVEGGRIDDACDARRLTIDERLALFETVCDAVQHAHRNLVVHRDLKPGNILVSDDGQVKLLDFGIATMITPDGAGNPIDRTLTIERRLTPAYASPEQVRGDVVTTATDVYSLGMILYELLTGRRPYDLDDDLPDVLVRMICQTPPTRPATAIDRSPEDSMTTDGSATLTAAQIAERRRTEPSRLRRVLSGDLETIMLKALRKEPERRYASVAALADDVRRFRSHLPVLAQKDSVRYRLARFTRRHTIPVAAALLLGVGLVAASIISTTMYLKADSAMRESETQRETADRVNRFLQDMLASIDPQFARGRDVSVIRQVVDEAAERLDADLGDLPDVAAPLHLTIGQVYAAIADPERAEHHLRRAIDLRVEASGAANLAATDGMLELATLFRDFSRYDDAEPLYRSALTIRERALGADHLDVAAVLSSAGYHYQLTGEYETAESFYRRALRLRTEQLGDDHPDVAETLNYLGQHLMYQNRHSEADAPLRRSITILRTSRGDDDLALVDPLGNRAVWLQRDGQLDEAERHLQEAITIAASQLEADHPTLTNLRAKLANLFTRQGDFDAAKALYREILTTEIRVLGEMHSEVGTSTNNLASVLRATGELEDATVLFARAADIYRASLGNDHYWVSIALSNAASIHERLGEVDQAESMIEECLRIRHLHSGTLDWQFAELDSIRGGCLVARETYAEAESLLLDSHAVLSRHFNPTDRVMRETCQRLAELYAAQGRPVDAAAWRDRIVDSQKP